MPSPQQKIAEKRITGMLNYCSESGGYSARETGLLRLAKDGIQIEGVDMVGDDDTAPRRGAKCVVTFEMEIDEGCCNMGGNAHGGFLAWLVDMASSMAMLPLAGHERWRASGVSTNINVYYIAGVPLGAPIRIISTVMNQGKTSATLECRIENRTSGQLYTLGVHAKQDVKGNAPWSKL